MSCTFVRVRLWFKVDPNYNVQVGLKAFNETVHYSINAEKPQMLSAHTDLFYPATGEDGTVTVVNSADSAGLFGEDTFLAGNDMTASDYTVLWADPLAKENYTGTGDLVTFVFRVHENATGTISLDITCDPCSTFGKDLQDVRLRVDGEDIPVQSHLAADVNADGVVNLQDVVHLSRYMAGWDIVLQ